MITEPMPSMPLFFWGDEDGSRLRESYFSMYPGIWRHGDWIEITSRGTAIIYGRSDSTINRGGVRMGTSELYRAVLSLDEIVDALAVDVPRPGTDGWLLLFVVMRDGVALDDAIVAEIRARIRSRLLTAPRARRRDRDRRGPPNALGQDPRGPGKEDPHGRPARAGGLPRESSPTRRRWIFLSRWGEKTGPSEL